MPKRTAGKKHNVTSLLLNGFEQLNQSADSLSVNLKHIYALVHRITSIYMQP
ncbi:MAG: hypothetical protein MJZ99_07190 [Bacteroidales bacterium]|nr:hypothetical protein [Bacteroidales bacterium]